MTKRLLSVAAVSFLMAASAVPAMYAAGEENEKPLMTIGCISDLHNELGLINGSADNVRLRGSIVNTLNKMREQEKIDLLVVGGDVTSDCTIPEANWLRVKDLVHQATKGAFPEGATSFPVLYCTGNHDYEVANFDAIPKAYNAARFYDFMMRDDMGALPENECFYEECDNGSLGKMNILAAYHYLYNGLDFVVLNCGKNFFKSAWDYNYSDESVQWVSNKLDEIYAVAPDKTVFFIAHVPFPDSNSISSSRKGMSNSEALKRALARHPNVVFLYGHDHGTDSAYIREKTSQRVTRYDVDGNVISSFDDTHIDGLEPVAEVPDAYTSGRFRVVSVGDGKNIGFDGNNLATVTDENISEISYTGANGAFTLLVGDNGNGQKHLHIGSGGRFSIGDPTDTYFYRVTSAEGAAVITAELASNFNTTDRYLLVSQRSGSYYALSNSLYNAGSANQRLEGVSVTLSDNSLSLPSDDNVLWQFVAEGTVTEPENPVADENTEGSYYVTNVANGLDLGFDGNNAATIEKNLSKITYNAISNTFLFEIGINATGQKYLHIGSGGRFSLGDASVIYLYKVKSVEGGTITGERASSFNANDSYILVGQRSGAYYALSNTLYNAGSADQRMESVEGSFVGDTFTVSGGDNLLWKFTAAASDPVETADPSFVSAFMGSMRYYNNSIEGDVSVTGPRVVQAMMVYVYSDRLVLQMKNYGETGSVNGVHIAPELEPYTIFRSIEKDPNVNTGADIIESEKSAVDDATYDLQGRKVTESPQGIYIRNGKKIAR